MTLNVRTRIVSIKPLSTHSHRHSHLVGRLEARVSELRDRVGLVLSLAHSDDRSVGGEREVDTREGDQVDWSAQDNESAGEQRTRTESD